jgi:hypothetical protein
MFIEKAISIVIGFFTCVSQSKEKNVSNIVLILVYLFTATDE